jgi:two-component system sensor histidine kinase KdpD
MPIARRLSALRGYLGALAGLVLVTLAMWLARSTLTLAAIALVYLLAVLCAALWWGMGPAVAGSVLAFLALDYLFVPPLFSFTIAAPSEVVSLVVFLTVAVITSRFAAWARARAREAEARARESRALLRLSDAIAEAGSAEAVVQAIAALTASVLGVRSCALLLPDALGVLHARAWAPAGDPCDLTREEEGVAAYVWREQTPVPHRSALYVPVRIGAQRVGVLRIGPRPDGRPLPAAERQLLRTLAAAAAAAIDRRRLQDAAAQAEVLRKSDELKNALLNTVSHDLRTPLATLKTGITALLQDDLSWSRQEQRETLAAANEEVDRLTRLIDNLLDLSRIEAGALRPDRQWYEIGELIAQSVRRAAARLRDHDVTVAVSSGDLPLCVDYVQIQQVLANLLDNAARYSPAGAEIHVTGCVEGDAFVIRVRDQGPGIPLAEAERIFSKFYRIGRRRDGTGLGLAICKGLVEAHGGRIAVENPGRPGAVFAVSLPLTGPPAFAGTPT